MTKTMPQSPPIRSAPATPLLYHHQNRKHQLLVGCCITSWNGSHLRPLPPPFLSIFDAHCFVAPNKGTSHCNCKPSAGRLQWAHREQRRNDLGAPLLHPWRESKTAGKGGGGGGCSFWLLCVVCIFVVVLCVWEQLLATILEESQLPPRQNSQLLNNHIIKSAPKDPKY